MAESDRVYTAALVIIGDEILSGRTQDANLAYLATWLNSQGIRLRHVEVAPDVTEDIVDSLNRCRARYDYVFTTGGIGPTHDDITVDAIAAAFGVPVVLHPKAEAMLRAYYGERITEARLRMARVPEGAELVENAVSTAPGIRIGNVFILAGIPAVMQSMLAALVGTLAGGKPVLSRTVGAHVAESTVAQLLAQVERDHPGSQIGSYPFYRAGKAGANFVVRSTEQATIDAVCTALLHGLAGLGVEGVDGEL
jgi:molybdenum cofactor synthesis domain-containing protein